MSFLIFGVAGVSLAQSTPQADTKAALGASFDAQRWQDVVDRARPLVSRDADTEYRYGVALAQLGRWDEARAALLRGHALRPDEARFATELGGVAFKQKDYAEAATWLRRALRLEPGDAYSAEFLATVYFLEGNLDAALKYWNRAGKPKLASVDVAPGLQVDPVLLDRAFAFAPGETLLLPGLLTTRERLAALGIFPNFDLRLQPRQDGAFDAAFAASERDGFGAGKLAAALSILRGVGYQTVYPEYFNAARSAINVTSLVRWDDQKRRVEAGLSGPLGGNPKYRYRLGADLRNENWELRPSFAGPAPVLGALNLRRSAVSGEVTSFESGAWNWSLGGELSQRDFRNVFEGPGLPRNTLLQGYQLKETAAVNRALWHVPERRFESSLRLASETGRIWSSPAHTFEKLQAGLTAHWLPRMTGDDAAVTQQFRAGRMYGSVPFDELSMLGLERDNDLWMRAHIGTRDGRKGSAPLGRNYFVSNSEIDKHIFNNGLVTVKLSPFLDTGKMTGAPGAPGATKWLWDTGLQAKVRVLGVGFAVIYGKDLRTGNNAVYLMAGR